MEESVHTGEDKGFRRRAFVASAAAGAAALALPAVEARAGTTGPNVDVVVIGSGMAGLSAAYKLLLAGRSVVVLEADSRIGGRVLNLSTGPQPDDVTEAGGEWVAKRQHRILALCKQLGIQTFHTYTKGDGTFYDGQGHPHRYSGAVPPIGPGPKAELLAAIAELTLMADKVNLAAPEKTPKAAEWDSMTTATWLDDNVTTHRARAVLETAVGGPVGGTAQNTSLLHYLFIAKANGGPLDLTSTDGALAFRIKGGSGLIAQRLAQRVGKARIKLSTPVRGIEQGDGGVKVTTADGGVYTAGAVVVAMAPAMAARIHYDPQLPAARDQFTQHASMGWLIKCFAVYRNPFWRANNLNGMVASISPPLSGVFDNSPPDGSVGCLYGLIAGDQARIWTHKSAADRRRAVLRVFNRCFGGPALNPVDYLEYNWAEQPYIRGGAAMSLGPGVLTEFPGVIRKPVQRIHWASTETAMYSWGDMDGAILSGERAAKEILS